MKSLIVAKLSKASCIKVIKKKKKKKKREKEIQRLIETPSVVCAVCGTGACGAGLRAGGVRGGVGDSRWVRVLLGCHVGGMLGSASTVCRLLPEDTAGTGCAEDAGEGQACLAG